MTSVRHASRFRRRFLRQCFGVWLLAGICLASCVSRADEPGPAAADAAEEASEDKSARAEPLPKSLDAFEQVYFYQSQAAELLPSQFRPIDIQMLDEKLSNRKLNSGSTSDSPQIVRGVYIARLEGGDLVSNQSYLEVAYDGTEPARLALSKIGVALSPAGDAYLASGPGIVTDTRGFSSILIEKDCRVSFGWNASGSVSERGLLFDLQLPMAGQAKLLVEVPQNRELVALDGVGQQLPSPPLEAAATTASSNASEKSRWYSIEAGGLTRVRLRVSEQVKTSTESVITIRQASLQYDLMPASIKFTARMLLDAKTLTQLPPLLVQYGHVTSVRVGGTALPWTELPSGQGSELRFDGGRVNDVPGSSNGTLSLVIEGETAWGSGGGAQSLPWMSWLNRRPILIPTEMQAQLRADSSMRLARLQLPNGWRYLPTLGSEDGSRVYRCVGPISEQGLSVLARPYEVPLLAESILRLGATSNRFTAQYDTSLAINTTGPVPIQLRVDRDWKTEFVTVVSSGRVLDLPSDDAARRNVTIWPTSDEVVNGRLHLRVTGSMPQRISTGRSEFPATSFVQIQNVRNRVVAAVTPPPGFSWTGEVALRASRISMSQLTPIQKELVGELRDESLLIDMNEGRLPMLVSRRPDAALNARNRLVMKYDGDQLSETLLIACESSTTDIQSMVVDLGASEGRPEMQWSAVLPDGKTRRIESIQRVTPESVGMLDTNQGSTSGVQTQDKSRKQNDADDRPKADQSLTDLWQLSFGEPGERRLLLVGRRSYPMGKSMHLPLPLIPGAAGQISDVLISPSLSVDRMSGSIQKVPLVESSGTAFKNFAALGPDVQPELATFTLRYEATEKPSIELISSSSRFTQPIVSHETLRIVASNRGGDWLVACYEFAFPGTLVIDQDPSLRLISVSNQDEEPVPYEETEHQLRVTPGPTDTCLFYKWSRPTVAGSLIRRWTTPKLKSNALVLQRDWRVVSAADTLIPRILMDGQADREFRLQSSFAELLGYDWLKKSGTLANPSGDHRSTLVIHSGRQRFVVVDATLGFPVMAMFALLLFALGWWIADRNINFVMAIWATSLIPGFALLPSSHIWFGTVCLPLACGGMISVCQRYLGVATSASRTSILWPARSRSAGEASRNQGDSAKRERPSSRAITWSSRLLLVIAVGTAWLVISSTVRAQDSAGPSTTAAIPAIPPATPAEPAVELPPRNYVLIPTDESGKPQGSKVYIDQALYSQLYREQLPTLGTVRLATANYRVRLDSVVDAKPQAELEARFQLEDSAQRAEFTLPFRSSEVKSVQWLTERDTRALRWLADSENSIRITLPSASNATILIRANIDVLAESKLIKRLKHAIVPVPGATLLVDAGASVQRIELTSCLGRWELQAEPGRLTASIGAINELDLSVVYRDPSRSQPTITERRYWVHAGQQSTNIECEVELNDPSILQGTELSLVVSDGAMPQMMTDEWLVVSSDNVTPTRRQLQVKATKDNPGPLRFLWETQSVVVPSQRTDLPAAVSVPEVFTSGATTGSPSTIAFDAAPGLRLAIFNPTNPVSGATVAAADDGVVSSTRSEAIDAFVSRWKGFRATASEIISTKGTLPRLVITAPNPNLWQADEEHHLHVRPGELQIGYTATIIPGDRLLGPMRLVIPPNSELRVLTVNGVSVDGVPYRIGNRDEIVLNEMTGTDPVRLRAILHLRIPQTGRFNPPRVSVEPAQVVRGTYTMTRDQTLAVQELLPNGILETNTPPLSINQQLTGGWIPCWSWKIDEFQSPGVVDTARKPQLNGVFRVEPRSVVAECQQVNLLKWEQSRWLFETHIRLENTALGEEGEDAAIDFVNVELPTSWCENLAIEPEVTWSRQPAIDPATQIVRIRPVYSPGDRSVSLILRGWRLADSDARIEVPSIRVLGVNKREMYIAVPQAIEGRSLDWEAHSALDAAIPGDWLSKLNENAVLTGAIRELQLEPNSNTYLALTGNATVKLVPSREQASSPTITMSDVKLLATSSENMVAIHRWDLSPSWREDFTIRMPQHAKVRGIWVDDRPVAWTKQNDAISIPLVYSRLAQAVTVIYEESVTHVASFALAQVDDITVQETWLTVMQSQTDARHTKAYIDAASQWHLSDVDAYELAALKSTNRVTELSLANTADRSQEEVAAWLRPWARRVDNLLVSKNRIYADATSESEPSERTLQVSEMNAQREQSLAQWQQYLTQFGVESDADNAPPFLALVSPSVDHWQLSGILRVDGQAEASPEFHLVSSSTHLEWAIRLFLCSILMIGLLMISHRFRRWLYPYGTEAAIWLFAIGVSSLAVAPIPVAIAICVVAITLPWLNQMQQRRLGV